MDYTPVTPFRRTMDAVILEHQAAAASADLPPSGANKWEVLRELGAARTAFGLSDRDIAVLQALISFHPATILGGNDDCLVVHPSNKSICERLNGMACSTMRRHLGNLVHTGFILRRDSPNGKRYARRYGDEKVTFGFDLSPLVRRYADICASAEAIRADQERFQRLRTAVSLMRRDLAGLVDYGRDIRPDLALWDQLSDLAALTARTLRRKLDMADLRGLEASLLNALNAARDVLESRNSQNMSTSDALNEHQHQNSNEDSHVLEPRLEKAKGADLAQDRPCPEPEGQGVQAKSAVSEDEKLPNIPLGLVLAACHEFKAFVDTPVRHWHDLVRVADTLRSMMGISPSAWDEAKRHMGPEEASVVLVAMLDRFADIRSPGGYLRALTDKAARKEFSCGPMVMALMRRDAA